MSETKKITSAQINDATQTRFVPGPEKKPDIWKEKKRLAKLKNGKTRK